MPLPSNAFDVPEIQELWATAQETKAVFLSDVKATAEAVGAPIEELVEWLTEEGITILSDEVEESESQLLTEAEGVEEALDVDEEGKNGNLKKRRRPIPRWLIPLKSSLGR